MERDEDSKFEQKFAESGIIAGSFDDPDQLALRMLKIQSDIASAEYLKHMLKTKFLTPEAASDLKHK